MEGVIDLFCMKMDSFDDNGWDLIDCSNLLHDLAPTDFYWVNHSAIPQLDASLTAAVLQSDVSLTATVPQSDASFTAAVPQDSECAEKESSRTRGRNDSSNTIGSKACRERQRRERLNDRFLELSSTLESGRPASTDKLAILCDAIRVLNQLKTESQEYKESNEKLEQEIKTLKEEKNELRKEKLVLQADKTRMEQQLKAMTALPAGFVPPHPAAYQQVGQNNMPVFPGYSFVPMWHYLPPSARDTTHDHELRPPAA